MDRHRKNRSGSVDSTEVEKLLREDFYDGESFRRLVNEPLLYCVAAWLIVAYLAFVMRGDIGYEWRQLRRAVTEPQWSMDYGRDWPENRDGIVARIRLRIARGISEQKAELEWPSVGPAISRRFGLKKLPNPETVRRSDRPESTQVRGELSTARQLATPPLCTPQNHHLSVVLSSPDRLHRVLRIRKQNRGRIEMD